MFLCRSSAEGELQDAVRRQAGGGDSGGGGPAPGHAAGGRVSRERRHTTDYPGQCVGLRSQECQNVGVRVPGGALTIRRRHSERRRDRLHTGVGYTHMARMREMVRMITFRLPVQNGAGGFVA